MHRLRYGLELSSGGMRSPSNAEHVQGATHFTENTDRKHEGFILATASCLGTGAMGGPVMRLFDPWSKPVLLMVRIGVCAVSLGPSTRRRMSRRFVARSASRHGRRRPR